MQIVLHEMPNPVFWEKQIKKNMNLLSAEFAQTVAKVNTTIQYKLQDKCKTLMRCSEVSILGLHHYLFVLRFYGPVNPMGSCRAWSVYLTTRLLGRLSPLSG